MSHIWVMVANSATARFFEAKSNKELKEVETMSHPESRLHNRDLVSDKPGRGFESAITMRHAKEPKTTPKTVEFENFAESLCHFLEEAHRGGKFSKLYIAANPSFLGILRQTIHKPEITQTIVAEYNIDMTQMHVDEIRKHLPYIL